MHRRFTLVVVLALMASACGGDDGIEVDRAWARPSPQMANTGAVYLEITSPVGDRLIGAAVDASVAARAEIHETSMSDAGDDGMGGTMTMQEVGEIALPEGETVSLEPGGLHIMLLDLTEPLMMGESFDVILDFESGESITVAVGISDEAP